MLYLENLLNLKVFVYIGIELKVVKVVLCKRNLNDHSKSVADLFSMGICSAENF